MDEYELRKWGVPVTVSEAECCATCAHYCYDFGGDAGGTFSSEPYAGSSRCLWRGHWVEPYQVCAKWIFNEKLKEKMQGGLK